MGRIHMGRTNVDVDIDVRVVLDTIDGADLRAYMNERFGDAERDLAKEASDFASEIEDHLVAGRADDALLLAQRWSRPKFETFAACVSALAASRRNPQQVS